MNGFGSRSSDMDLCLMISHNEVIVHAICVVFHIAVINVRSCRFLHLFQLATELNITGPGFLWFGLASCSNGRCSGPSTLINVVGKRNLNGINVYLR